MNPWTKRLCLLLVLVVVSAALFACLPAVQLAETSEADEVLLFLEEVVRIDVAKYDVTLLGTSVTYPDWLGGLAQVTGKFSLESETSKLDVLFKFRNGTLSWCLMRVIEGSPHYIGLPSGSIRDLAGDFLQNYQDYSDDSELEQMKDMLDLVDVTENFTTTVDNLKLTVSVTPFSSCFDWSCTLDGADCGGVDVSFHNGHFYAFGDDRSYYQMCITQ
jgi:hypothetical protein